MVKGNSIEDQKVLYITSVAIGFECSFCRAGNQFQVLPVRLEDAKDFLPWFFNKYPERQYCDTATEACHWFLASFVEYVSLQRQKERPQKTGPFSIKDYEYHTGKQWKNFKDNAPCYEASYRRGYCHGYGAAMDDYSSITKKGYTRKSVIYSIMSFFHFETLMNKWRYGGVCYDIEYPPTLEEIKNLTEMKEEKLKQCGSKCAGCKKKVQRLHLDHIIPLADGGAHNLENMQLLCVTCHREKTGDENSYTAGI